VLCTYLNTKGEEEKNHQNKWDKLIYFHQHLHLGLKELIIFQAEGGTGIPMNIVANCVWVTHFQLAGGDVAFPSFNAGPAIVLTADGAAMVGMIVPTDRMKSAVVSSSRCFQWEAEQLAGWLLFLGLAVWVFYHVTQPLIFLYCSCVCCWFPCSGSSFASCPLCPQLFTHSQGDAESDCWLGVGVRQTLCSTFSGKCFFCSPSSFLILF